MEQQIIAELMARGIPQHIAVGMTANMIAESGLNPGINELRPVVAGSRGGYGLNQWTGPRRRQYEAYATERGAPLDDLDTQLDFTLWELQNTEKGAWNALSGAKTAEDAAAIYSNKFLRPGVPHMDRRLAEARRLAGMGDIPAQPQAAPYQAGQQPTVNALAPQPAPQLNFNPGYIDPATFMRPRGDLNALAMAPFMRVKSYGA